ncbi:hypothetical protein EDB85DRAFT_1890667 [Lactarius pseudohatsudake]|nr:hypothetical protein EDB85DRAFT_1890667 [Lactarius pseudohatsudake]
MGGGLYWRNTGGIQSRFRWSTCQKNRSSTTGLNLVRLVRRLEKSINGRLGYGTQLDAIPQIGECAIATGARPKIAGKRGARQRDSTFGMSARHHNLEAQTQEDLDADWLNAQKAREAPRGHPRTAGQARHVYALCERAAADVDLLLSSAHEPSAFLLPDRTPSTTGGRNTGGDAASASAVLQHSAALQEELAAHVAGQLRRNAEHFSRRAGGGPEGVRRVAEEKVRANHEVMKREREWLCDRRWKALRTTCMAISNHRDCGFGDALCHSVHVRGDRRWALAS